MAVADAPIRRGAYQNPIKFLKMHRSEKTYLTSVEAFCNPVIESKGPTPPDESCNNNTDNKRAVKEINISMRP
jgi:hypothetical protein